MLRSAMLLAALLSSLALAQAQNAQTDETRLQARDAGEAVSSTTGRQKETPYPDMMKAWEYSPQEWR